MSSTRPRSGSSSSIGSDTSIESSISDIPEVSPRSRTIDTTPEPAPSTASELITRESQAFRAFWTENVFGAGSRRQRFVGKQELKDILNILESTPLIGEQVKGFNITLRNSNKRHERELRVTFVIDIPTTFDLYSVHSLDPPAPTSELFFRVGFHVETGHSLGADVRTEAALRTGPVDGEEVLFHCDLDGLRLHHLLEILRVADTVLRRIMPWEGEYLNGSHLTTMLALVLIYLSNEEDDAVNHASLPESEVVSAWITCLAELKEGKLVKATDQRMLAAIQPFLSRWSQTDFQPFKTFKELHAWMSANPIVLRSFPNNQGAFFIIGRAFDPNSLHSSWNIQLSQSMKLGDFYHRMTGKHLWPIAFAGIWNVQRYVDTSSEVRHEFLVLGARLDQSWLWLRFDRARTHHQASATVFEAFDTVKIGSSRTNWRDQHENPVVVSSVRFDDRPDYPGDTNQRRLPLVRDFAKLLYLMEGRYPDYKLFEENCWFTANLGISTLRCLFGGYTEESSTSRPDWISIEELESFTAYCVEVFKQTRFDIQRSPTVLFPVLTAEDIMKCKWDPAFEVPSHPCGPNAKAPLIQLAETTAPSKVAPSTSSSLSISSTGSTPTLAVGAKSSFFAIAALADGNLFNLHGSQSRSTTSSTSTTSSSFSLPLQVPPPPPPYKAHVDWHFNSKTVKRFFSSRRRFLASAVVPFSKAARVITEGDPDKGRS